MIFNFRFRPVSYNHVSIQPKPAPAPTAISGKTFSTLRNSVVSIPARSIDTTANTTAAATAASSATDTGVASAFHAISNIALSMKDAASLVIEGQRAPLKFAFLKTETPISKLITLRSPPEVNHTFPRFKPYENLTGLSALRPEIIAAFGFESLADRETQSFTNQVVELTPAGELFDSQIQLFNLKYEAFRKLFNDLRTNTSVTAALDQARNEFLDELNRLKRHIDFLTQAVSLVENAVSFLDLRDLGKKPDLNAILYDYFRDVSVDVSSQIAKNFGSDLTLQSVLKDVGFSSENVAKFSSTKIYVQSLYELKKLLIGPSDQLVGTNLHARQTDDDATQIIKTTMNNVNRDIAFFSSANFTDIQNITPDSIPSSVKALIEPMDSFTKLQAAGSDERVAMLVQAISREFLYSTSALNTNFNQFIQRDFGYTFNSNGNETFFDTLIGDPGTRVIDRIVSSSPNAFMNLGQQPKSDFIVLPLEIDYIDFDNSTFSPGSVFYVQEALKLGTSGFNVAGLDELRKIADDLTFRSSAVFKQLVPVLSDQTINRSAISRALIDPVTAFTLITDSLFDPATGRLKDAFQTSNIGIVFDRAQSDSNLKTLLFLYFTVQAFKTVADTQETFTNNSPATIQRLATEIATRVNGALPNHFVGLAKKISRPQTNVTSLENELTGSDALIDAIVALIKTIFDEFRTSKCFTGDHLTIYSGMRDGTVLLLIFETIFSIFNRVNEKKAISLGNSSLVRPNQPRRVSPNISVFNALKSIDPFTGSVISKLTAENSLKLKASLILLSIWSSLANALKNTILFLQQKSSVDTMNELLQVVGDNSLLAMLVNEQQVNLIRNSIEDIESKFAVAPAALATSDAEKIDESVLLRSINRSDLVLLDDFLIPSNIKKMILAYFMDHRFSSTRSFNARVLSLGIPQGTKNSLRARVNVKHLNNQSLLQKEHDVIRVKVYRIDVMNPAVVFKPKEFLFDLSRFVSRDYSKYLDITSDASREQIINSIPFRDLTFNGGTTSTVLEYGNDSALFKNPIYDFLSDEQKAQILENHIESHFLYLYSKLLTGFSLDEMDFLIDDAAKAGKSMKQIIVDALVEETVRTTFNVPSEPGTSQAPNKSSVPAVLQAVKANLQGKQITFSRDIDRGQSAHDSLLKVTELTHRGNVVIDAGKTKTNYSDADFEARKIFTPKVFDRVFNVFVDPDDFDIDVAETSRTEFGHSTLNSLLLAKRIVLEEGQAETFATDIQVNGSYRIAAKGLKDQTPVFDKYFAVIETVLTDDV